MQYIIVQNEEASPVIYNDKGELMDDVMFHDLYFTMIIEIDGHKVTNVTKELCQYLADTTKDEKFVPDSDMRKVLDDYCIDYYSGYGT